jgi:diacylglycerol kinase family enzyme
LKVIRIKTVVEPMEMMEFSLPSRRKCAPSKKALKERKEYIYNARARIPSFHQFHLPIRVTERTKNMNEKRIEQFLVKRIKQYGGLALKFVSPGWDGAPDRILLLPNGRICFAEIKAPGGKLRPLQRRRKSQIERLGFRVFVIDGTEQIGGIISEIYGA